MSSRSKVTYRLNLSAEPGCCCVTLRVLKPDQLSRTGRSIDGTQIGWTALHYAAKNRDLEVAEFLVGLEKVKNEEEAKEAALRHSEWKLSEEEAHLEAMRNQFAAQEQAELDRLTSEANAAEKMGNDEMERVLVQIRMPGAR